MSEPIDSVDLRPFQVYFREACGLVFRDTALPRVAEILAGRISMLGMCSFREYFRLLTSAGAGSNELTALASLLTIGETYFFRNKNHWRALEECVLPELVQRSRATGERRIRIWSAGCSTGEEAYTAGIVLARSLPEPKRWSIEIVGTDISSSAVAHAQTAIYGDKSLHSVLPEIRERYFERMGAGRYRLCAEIRQLARFRELNLFDATALRHMHEFDVILCRNVLIYFDASGRRTAMTRLHDSLRPGGFLFLGHAEHMPGGWPGFAILNKCDTFFYKSIPLVEKTETSSPAHACQARGEQSPVRIACPTSDRLKHIAALNPQGSPVKAVCSAPCACPAPASIPDTPFLNDLRNQAVAHLDARQQKKARQIFEQILSWVPDDIGSLQGMALLHAGAGSGEEALRYCRRLLDVCATSAEAYGIMALVHEGRGENALAQRELEKSIYLDNTFAMAHFRQACLHDRMGQREKALRGFSNALKALQDDDEQRVRVYSGGFDRSTIMRVCELRLDATSAATPGAGAVKARQDVGI